MTYQSKTDFQSVLAAAGFFQFFICILLAVAIPKATTISLAVLVCGSMFLVLIQGGVRSLKLRDLPLWLFVLAWLPLLVGASGFWSPDPSAAAIAAVSLGFAMLAFAVVASSTCLVAASVQSGCQSGFLVGVSLAVCLAAIDFVGNQWLTRWVFSTWPSLHEAGTKHVVFQDGKAVAVSVATANRRAIALICIMPAFLYCIVRRGFSASFLISIVGLTAFAALLVSTHSLTTQMAFSIGAITFVAATYLPRLARSSMAFIWTTVWLLTVPVTIGMAEMRLQDAKWLPFSSMERVRIWSAVAWDVLDKPVFGHGVGAKSLREDPTERSTVSAVGKPVPIHHPHNGYLQVWHELGVVGALAFMAFGFWLLRLIDQLRDNIRPYFLSLFGICAAVTSTGFGMWQHWHLSAFALGAAILWIVTQDDQIDQQ